MLTRHRRKTLILFDNAEVSATQSTLTTSSFTGASFTWTYTARDASGTLLSGVPVVFTVDAEALISAGSSIVTANPTAIANDGVASSTITSILLDTDGDPVVGFAAASTVLAVNGTNNTLTQPAAVSTINGIQTSSFVTTQAATKVASITAGGLAITDTASVVSSAGVGDLTPLFFSDWASVAPGTSVAIVGDGGKWEHTVNVYNGGIVAASGLGFPAAAVNVFRVQWAPGGGGFIRTASLGTLSIGDTRYYRYYMRCDIPDAQDGSHNSACHPMQDGFAGSNSNWEFPKVYYDTGGDGFWTPRFIAPGHSYPYIQWTPTSPLDKGVVYRFEHYILRTGTSTFKAGCRIYTSAGVLVYDVDDFTNAPDGSTVMSTYVASNDFTATDMANIIGLNAGTNENGESAGEAYYQWGFAVCDNQGWIGAYGSVVGEV